MRVKFLFIVLILLSSVLIVNAQNKPVIKFDSTTLNFGKVREEGGKVSKTFFFTNAGTDTLKLLNVKPGCGCTTADWTKSPILPGQRGYILAQYDPHGRPGIFNKAINVTSNASDNPMMLIIKGEVLPRVKTVIDTFPVTSGNLLMKSNHVAFLEIKNNAVKTDTLEILNYWNKPMTFKVTSIPEHIIFKVVPELLQPKQKGLIIVTYDAAKKNDYGLVYDYVNLVTNDTSEASKPITVSANITEDFSKLTDKQRKNAPKIAFTSDTCNFGTAKEGDIVKFSFEFKNNGKDKLIIHKTKASCGCTVSTPEKTLLKKGESSKINVEFNTDGKKGVQRKTITVISNDPAKPIIILNIIGKVTAKV
jgi:hypothetical protein